MNCPVCNDTGRVTHHRRKGKKYVRVEGHPCVCNAGKLAREEDRKKGRGK